MTNYIPLLNKAIRHKIPRFFYAKYKEKLIMKALQDNFDPIEASKPFGLFLDERIVEYPWLISKIKNIDGCLLDAGSVLNFNYLLHNTALRNKKIFISTLAPEKHAYWNYGISYVYEDMRDICYKDNYFDMVTCLSVIEHVGMDNTKLYTCDPLKNEQTPTTYLTLIAELRRVIKSGGTLFLTIPFGKHQNYGWLQVFDGSMVDLIIKEFKPSTCVESYFKYSRSGWESCSRTDAVDCEYFDVYDISYNHNSDRAVAAEAVVLLELRK